jgi:hypothetical protein
VAELCPALRLELVCVDDNPKDVDVLARRLDLLTDSLWWRSLSYSSTGLYRQITARSSNLDTEIGFSFAGRTSHVHKNFYIFGGNLADIFNAYHADKIIISNKLNYSLRSNCNVRAQLPLSGAFGYLIGFDGLPYRLASFDQRVTNVEKAQDRDREGCSANARCGHRRPSGKFLREKVLLVMGGLVAGFYLIIDTFKHLGRRTRDADALRIGFGGILIGIGCLLGAFTLATL